MKAHKLSSEERNILLQLARSAIASRLMPDSTLIKPQTPPSTLIQKQGCFVTLHKQGDLRGCVGTIEPVTPLIDCVEENALNAAFHDPRFSPLSQEELSDVEIEISVLSVPEVLEYYNSEDLKTKLEPHVHGVILSKGLHRSTFLPQVWQQLPDVENFLGQLCLKGGMGRSAWKDKDTAVSVYTVEYFSEPL